MKLFLSFICFVSIFFHSCTLSEIDTIKPEVNPQMRSLKNGIMKPGDIEQNFPKKSKEFGIAVAREMHEVVNNLNKLGVDYTSADKSQKFKTKFYKDLQMASPNMRKGNFSTSQIEIPREVVAKGFLNMTAIQIQFVSRIIKECGESISINDFERKITKLNKDIYSSVPEIEQERLFNVTAVFYYGVKEIESLEKKGLMLPSKQSLVPRMKSGGEDGGMGGSCRKFLATGWAIALGEPTPAGEIVMGIATVYIAGVLMYEIITCAPATPNPSESICGKSYSDCILYSNPQLVCFACFEMCMGQGYWICAGEW